MDGQPNGRDVLVLGAGVVGVATALSLQRDGFRVTLVDRGAPGEACSFGNAGGMGGNGSVAPLAMPGILKKVPRLLIDRHAPLFVRAGHFPRALPWFLRFLAASRPARVAAIADARARLMRQIDGAAAVLVAAAGAEDLVRRSDAMVVYGSADALAAARPVWDMSRDRGSPVQEITGAEARRRVPALGPAAACAVLIPDYRHTVNPLALTQRYVAAFTAAQGQVRRATVRGLTAPAGQGPVRVETDQGPLEADAAVLACGVWSGAFARQLGYRVPLEAQRGYHAVIADPGIELPVPTTLGDRHCIATPMQDGIRISGIAEFAPPEAAPDWRHVDRMVENVQAYMPGLKGAVTSRWFGARPQTPDTLPVIGRAPRHPAVYFAFGHGQNGLQMSAITGRLVADQMAGRPPAVDLAPYSIARF